MTLCTKQVAMSEPVHVFLASTSGTRSMICQAMEWKAQLVEVLNLLEDHGLTAHIDRACSVIPKRDDGSTIQVPLMASQSIAEVHSKVEEGLASSHSQHQHSIACSTAMLPHAV